MRPPVSTLLSVATLGGELSAVAGGRLRMFLPVDCPEELKQEIRRHKEALLALLTGSPFVVVRSELLRGELVIWTAEEADRRSLMHWGADPGSIYTKAELAKIVQERLGSETVNQLHHAKRVFDGRILR